MTGRSIVLPGFILVVLGMLAVVLVRKSGGEVASIRGSAMGTHWTVEWRGDAPEPVVLKREISATLEKWEQVLSQWRPDSDLSRFNRGEPATPELARVLELADGIKRKSGGAFDHHLLAEVHAAGFGPQGKGVDLSSIGKGFAVDRVCEHLGKLGMRDFVFALAGEVRAVGRPWQVEIEKPLLAESVEDHVVMLENQAVATSGNYRQFRETEEGLVTHIIDPVTGKPVIRPPSSVTVIAADCATASAWATAHFVLGPQYKGDLPELRVSWQHP
ncbi:FAD:protein FMN transferase [Luteolibacter sp. SL250]|uniref:FAD:protein FMN transferase n=1 Tax=Luteolibacter sp. SL250 TaxID=2995170 RepID=UPI00226DAB89|nr:FAD:protein FMN transferase [Luteolibacter sp. SL250]WAC20118.1 FAD:protein FMN transferase [Luteolibacter sp. SL250]